MLGLKFVRFKNTASCKKLLKHVNYRKQHKNRHCDSKNKFGGQIVKWRR